MSPKVKICKETGCLNQQTATGYCRLHYLKNWKEIKVEQKVKASKSVDNYVKHILKNNPDAPEAGSSKKASGFDIPEEVSGSSYYRDDYDSILDDLGNREDVDRLLDNIKVDKDF